MINNNIILREALESLLKLLDLAETKGTAVSKKRVRMATLELDKLTKSYRKASNAEKNQPK